MSDWLIETAELAGLPAAGPTADRVVLDCSWHLPESGRRAIDDFRAGHLPGARFVDLGAISDPGSPFVNMLPSAAVFAAAVGQLGIGNDTEVIVYDAGYVSARLWWMFRHFGHDRVRILNGGWRKWRAEGRPVETGDFAAPPPRRFVARPAEGRVARLEEVWQAIDDGSATILDARTPAKFSGRESSGYPGVASGAMPGAVNVFWGNFFDPAQDHAFVSPEAAAAIFARHGVDVTAPVIATCGSGVTACILGFMLERLGNRDWRLYDGSWHEWGQHPETPKVPQKAPAR
ncbi:MAG: sulfurtransferase [Rhodobacteraceae bacterium]|jgi:thiosulfate/3-mercaptopyruvate sulfurtransferase|nr:sulfurtransferase [Paracoccaceae bacterium]